MPLALSSTPRQDAIPQRRGSGRSRPAGGSVDCAMARRCGALGACAETAASPMACPQAPHRSPGGMGRSRAWDGAGPVAGPGGLVGRGGWGATRPVGPTPWASPSARGVVCQPVAAVKLRVGRRSRGQGRQGPWRGGRAGWEAVSCSLQGGRAGPRGGEGWRASRPEVGSGETGEGTEGSARRGGNPRTAPNKRLQPTSRSVRCAPASGRG